MRHGIHTAETKGWRALLLQAQTACGVHLSTPVEEHLVGLLLAGAGAQTALPPISALLNSGSGWQEKPAERGDRCLLYSGFYPEQLLDTGYELAFFVRTGREAYREHAQRHRCSRHEALAVEFVSALDVLLTLKVLHAGRPGIDALSAFRLWHDERSVYARHVLSAMSQGSVVSGVSGSQLLH